MTVLITLTLAGVDSGPFDLYSSNDGFTTPFETNVAKIDLIAGYSSALVPDYTATIRVQSKGDCINYVDIPVLDNTTTTTTSSSSTTTTTSSSSTTTTTTTVAGTCYNFLAQTNSSGSVDFLTCNGTPQTINLGGGSGPDDVYFCAQPETVTTTGAVDISIIGPCLE